MTMPTLEWLSTPTLRNPYAILAFSGWGDAGDSSTDAARHLIEVHDAETVARFDADRYFDFQVNRPVVTLDESGVRSIKWPSTEIMVANIGDQDVVVVLGEEPNFNWKRFVGELGDALVSLGVRTAVTLGSFAGQVPHTVPVPVVGSASATGTIAAHGLLPSRYVGPTGIIGVLSQTLSNRNIDTISLWAAVPHYLSSQSYPPGSEALLRKASEILGFNLDVADLEGKSYEFRNDVDAAVDESDELADYVRLLEAEGMDPDEESDDLFEEIERYLRDV